MSRASYLVVAALSLVVVGCGDPPVSEGAVPSNCQIDVQVEGRIFGDEQIDVGEGEVLALRIDGQPASGFGIQPSVASYRIIDASIDVSSGFPDLSVESGSYNQTFTSEFGVLVTFDVVPGTYRVSVAPAQTGGAVGTCQRDQL